MTPGEKVRHARRMLAFMEAHERGEVMPPVRAAISSGHEKLAPHSNAVWLGFAGKALQDMDALAEARADNAGEGR